MGFSRWWLGRDEFYRRPRAAWRPWLRREDLAGSADPGGWVLRIRYVGAVGFEEGNPRGLMYD